MSLFSGLLDKFTSKSQAVDDIKLDKVDDVIVEASTEFDKVDNVFVPDYNMGAMENVGCVIYRDDYV